MAQYLTIARPYAIAAFDDAKKSEARLQAWSLVLQVLAYITAQEKFIQLIFSPKNTVTDLKNTLNVLLNSIVEKQVGELGIQLENFITLLIENKRLLVLPDILTLYLELVAKLNNIMPVKISSAFELSIDQQKLFEQTLSKRFETKISASYEVDPTLIGGAVISTDRFVMDASIKGKLAKLYQSLNS